MYQAARYRKSATSGGSHGKNYALWIPNGERQAVLLLDYTIDITAPYVGNKIIRQAHIFMSGIEITGGSGTTCCDASGAWIEKKEGATKTRSQLPAPMDNQVLRGNWRQPDGLCPFTHYQKPYICLSDNGRNLANIGSTGMAWPALDEESQTVEEWSVKAIGSENLNVEIGTGINTDLTYIWLATPTSGYIDFPLYVNRTYKGSGIAYAMPSPDYAVVLNGMNSEYLAQFTTVNAASLWAGEPD